MTYTKPSAPPSKLPGSFDAKDWAKEFTQICAQKGIAIDEDWMLTWFANALMSGYDQARREQPSAPLVERLRELAVRWRESANLKYGIAPHASLQLFAAADELEAALADHRPDTQAEEPTHAIPSGRFITWQCQICNRPHRIQLPCEDEQLPTAVAEGGEK